MGEDKIRSLFSKDELRRLEKAAKDKNKMKLADWGKQFEEQVRSEYEREYEKLFKKELENSIDVFMLTIAYALHFNEKTKFGQKRISDFINDLAVTVDMFRTGEFNPEDYKQALKEDGIIIENGNKGGDSD